MAASNIDGKAIAAKVRGEVVKRVAAFREQHGRAPGLGVILVGDNPASQLYVRGKEKASTEVGMRGRVHRLPASTSQAELLALLDRLNGDDATDGILVQLPLPAHIAELAVLDSVLPSKDV